MDGEHVCHAVVDVFGTSGGPFDLWCSEHNADKQEPLNEEQRVYLERVFAPYGQ